MHNFRHVMLDLETLSTKSNACIVSIGAVFFSENKIGPSFYKNITRESCAAFGLVESKDTLDWWEQEENIEARVLWNCNQKPLLEVLSAFSTFLESSTWAKQVRVWGGGADFDNVILANAYQACSLPLPWNFRNNRCFRTMKNMFPVQESRDHPVLKHWALGDAETQSRIMQAILTQYNFVLK